VLAKIFNDDFLDLFILLCCRNLLVGGIFHFLISLFYFTDLILVVVLVFDAHIFIYLVDFDLGLSF
jgi:hypothetical protein